MKTDTPGVLDLKLAVVTKDAAPWLDAAGALGEVEDASEASGWTRRTVRTSAKLQGLAIRVTCLFGPPGADVTVGFVGADRIVSDGTTEIPDVSIATVPRVVGPPGRETLLAAVKEILKDAAKT